MKQFIIYTRVSTREQGKSGLGLEAQERDIDLYLEKHAEQPYEIIGTFCDVESGKRNDRPELNKAIELAKEAGATLLVAKLDRLSRKVSFISSLMEDKKLAFKVAMFPYATEFELHIYAALAQQERKFISMRTKQALAAAKARGVKLGGARPEAAVRHQAVKDQADSFASRVIDQILDYRRSGKSYRFIADQFNALGVLTAQGGRWHHQTVQRYEQRLSH
jgi:DNA invertase Pin-like site-specific DNA recombinase